MTLKIPAPETDFLDPRTGKVSSLWYQYLFNLDRQSDTVFNTINYGPTSRTFNRFIDSGDGGGEDYSLMGQRWTTGRGFPTAGGGGGTGATVGTATISFGSTPALEASVVVTGQTEILSTSAVDAWIVRTTTADNGEDEHEMAAVMLRLIPGSIVASTGFTITAISSWSFATGDFEVNWRWQ